MHLTLLRIDRQPDYTLGWLYLDGLYLCDTLEPRCIDWEREQKEPGKTAIPEGTYPIRWQWSNKFQREMPFLQEVPHFTGVMIHTGNHLSHTQGCILVGRHVIQRRSHDLTSPFLTASSEAFRLLLKHFPPGTALTITVQ